MSGEAIVWSLLLLSTVAAVVGLLRASVRPSPSTVRHGAIALSLPVLTLSVLLLLLWAIS